jgi:hypothetical protein
MNRKLTRVVFFASGIYDGALGVAFLFFAPDLFRILNVTPPNHFGYVHFGALMLILFAAMFFQIASDPACYRSLILYGAGLKASYTGVVFWHQLHGGLPAFWIPWAWADLVFLILFLAAWRKMQRT